MTNFEKYKEEILKHTVERLAVTKDNKITDCLMINCVRCKFDKFHCSKELTEWLYQEIE